MRAIACLLRRCTSFRRWSKCCNIRCFWLYKFGTVSWIYVYIYEYIYIYIYIMIVRIPPEDQKFQIRIIIMHSHIHTRIASLGVLPPWVIPPTFNCHCVTLQFCIFLIYTYSFLWRQYSQSSRGFCRRCSHDGRDPIEWEFAINSTQLNSTQLNSNQYLLEWI